MSITGMPAMTSLAYGRMASSAWAAVDDLAGDLPPHNYNQTGFKDTYDAAKYCGDYASGHQIAYACAAAYSIKLPADSRAGTAAKIEAVIASVYGDRWLAEGAIVSAFLTASEAPPTWETITDTAAPSLLLSSPDPAPDIDAVTTPNWGAPLRRIVRSNAGPDTWYDATVTAGTATDATQYLHVIIRLSDYISVPQIALVDGGTKDSAWIEGGAAFDGTSLQVQFDRAVASDDNTIVLANEFLTADTADGARVDASSEVVNLTHSAGIFYSDANPPTTHLGDLVMMRRVIAMRNIDSTAPRFLSPSGQELGFGVCDDFSYLRGKIGVVYEKVDTFDVYRLFGVTIMRGSKTDGGFINGISFDTEVPAPPAGQIVRFSFYGMSGMLPAINLNGALVPQYSAYPHSITDDFIHGEATGFHLNVGIGGGSIFSGAINPETTPFATITLQPLGHHDITNDNIVADAVLPLPFPWELPRHAVIVVTANVIGYTDDWVAADKTSTAVIWEPNDITLHLV